MISRRRLAVPALLAAAPLVFFFDVCVIGRAPLLRDLFNWFFPWRDLARQALSTGEIPLWNPWSYMGTPFLANMQSGLFYPLNAVFWILDFPSAMRWFLPAQFGITALMMHALMRALGCRPAAALTGAIGYAYGGWMLAHLEFPNKLSAAAWLPLLALGIIRWREGSARRGLLLGAAAIALSLAAGYPQTTATVWLGGAVLWGCALFGSSGAKPRASALARRLLSLPGMTLLGCAVAAVQLLPFAEAASLSERAGGRETARVLSLALEPGHFAGLLLPHIFGVPGYERYWGGSLLQFWLGHFYVGLPVLALALISPALLWPRSRAAASGDREPGLHRWAIGAGVALLVVSVALCLGEATPLAPLLVRAVPGLHHFRWFSTTSLLIAFALCWLAALALERLIARAETDAGAARRIAMGAVALAAIMSAAALVSFASPPAFLGLIRRIVSPVMLPDQEPFLVRHVDVVRSDVVRAALVMIVLAAVIAVASLGRLSWRRAGWAIPLLLFADLLGASSRLYHTGDPSLYTSAPATLEKVRSRVPPLGRIYVTRDTLDKDIHLYGQEQEGYYRWAAEIFLFNLNLPHRLFSASDGDPVRPGRTAAWHRDVEEHDDKDRRHRLLAAAGVTHVLRGSPGEPTGMIEVPGALPRAWVASGAVRVSAQEAFSRIGSGGWDHAIEALVEEDAPPGLRPPGQAVPHRVHAVRHTFNTVTVEVESEGPGCLVLAEMMTPGWTARLDGAPVGVFTADYLFRAVDLPAGRHTVEFLYRPAGVLWGAVLSVAGLIAMGALLLPAGSGRSISRRSAPTLRHASRGTDPAPPRTARTP